MGERGNPPVVTLVEPDDPNIGDPYVYGAERIFRCIGADISEHDAGIAFVPDTVFGRPYGKRVVAQNANGSGENYWTWSVFSTPPDAVALIDKISTVTPEEAEE